tara:strand:- start:429 stop:725 length:297 start_codon:yes stop_codon:yes gene_type:complete
VAHRVNALQVHLPNNLGQVFPRLVKREVLVSRFRVSVASMVETHDMEVFGQSLRSGVPSGSAKANGMQQQQRRRSGVTPVEIVVVDTLRLDESTYRLQ